MNRQNTRSPKVEAAFRLMDEMRDMLNDIAASASILGATPFEGAPACRDLSGKLHTALLEFEIELGAIGHHTFDVRKD